MNFVSKKERRLIRSIILSMMGTWGEPLLNFYEANSLWINLLVFIYGTVIVLSWVNLKNIRNSLILSLVTQLHSQAEVALNTPAEKMLTLLAIPWESAINQSRFPLVARQSDLVPHRLSVEAVQAMLPPEMLAKEAFRIFQLQEKREAFGRS